MYFAQGRYTCKGDVWAFAVTLWEILTFAREQPFEEFPDHRIVENATYFYQEDERKVSLRSLIIRRLTFIVLQRTYRNERAEYLISCRVPRAELSVF